ncbi:MAG: adenylosuccinate lyase, partial [Planctomycetota bacterium]|nr:adenylosuccinate lyase [Planctomycetota bacterium]
DEELPFLASESLMMAAVKKGGDRQDIHEAIRQASHAATQEIKEGRPNDLKERLKNEPLLASVKDQMEEILDPSLHTGRASQQVVEFIEAEVSPVLERLADCLGAEGEVNV